MFRKKPQLARVILTLKHRESLGDAAPDITETIEIPDGATFNMLSWGDYFVKREGRVLRSIRPRAGCTVDIAYFYL